MSLANAIRDYTEILNSFADSVNFNFFEVAKTTVLYIVNSFVFVLFYLFSFQWIKDISHLPVLLPTINSKILNESYVLENHLNLIELGPVSQLETNKLVVGFLNAFFLALPFSVPQLISIRRWLIQGSIAGLASVVGFRIGQTLFFASILLGFRFLIIPWLSYEPLTYIVGLLLLVNVIYDMTHENLVTIPQTQISRHLKIALLHFGLAWTEQTALFQYFSNNSFSTNFTNLDIFVTSQNSEFWASHIVYLFGLLIGGLFFDLLFLVGISNLLESLQIWFKVPLSTWKKQSNIWFLRISLALSFTSIPYYTLDYLFLGPLGLVSQDKTILQGSNFLFTKNKLDAFRLEAEKEMFLDPFNRNILLDTALEGYEQSIFETRNFEGERAWSYGNTIKKVNVTDASTNTKNLARRFFNSSALQKNKQLEEKSEVLKPRPSDLSNLNGNDPQKEFFIKQVEFDESQGEFNASFNERIAQDYSPKMASVPNSENQDELYNLLTTYYFPTFLNDSVKFQSRQEALIKNKFYANPVYKGLLSLYVDSILQQQPEDYAITKDQEKQLYQARLALEDYYNSLRNYADLAYNYQFNDTFGGSKSFSTKVYNQQFKGNLKVVRRLFGVTWDKEENPSNLRKVSFDQTLYETTPAKFYHEELNRDSTTNSFNTINPLPFYAGWDSELRKFVVSNRYLPRQESGSVAVSSSSNENLSEKNAFTRLKEKNSFKKDLENVNTNFTVKEFSSWPMLSTDSTGKNNFLFETAKSFRTNKELLDTLQFSAENKLIDSKLPLSINFASSSKKSILPPLRGGFMWPGENPLEFQNLVK